MTILQSAEESLEPVTPQTIHKPRRRGLAGRTAIRLGLLLVSVVTVFPLYWMISSSVKPASELQEVPQSLIPKHPTTSGYRTVFDVVPFAHDFLNSMFISSVATASVLLTSLLAGYVFAKYRFRGRDLMFWTVVSTMFMPPIVTLVPLYWMVSSLGLSDTYLGVLLPWLANAFGIFLMRQFIVDVPNELIEAARVDGASELRIVLQIVAPMVRPGLVTLAVFAFVYYWNNFLWPLSILQSTEKFPVVLGLSQLLSYNTSVQYQNVVMAGTLIASLPTLVIFVLAQRTFIPGIASSGVKG